MRLWGDERFRRLSASPPSGQFLWLYLLCGPQTNALPGLFRAGEAAMAEELDWPLDGFRAVFQEIQALGMAEYDAQTRVVYLPKAIIHNPPDNPNVVRAWRKSFDELPECELRTKAEHQIRGFLQGLGKPFMKPFDERLGPRFDDTVAVAVAVTGTEAVVEQAAQGDGWKLADTITTALSKTRFANLTTDQRWWQAQFRLSNASGHAIDYGREVLAAEAWCTSNPTRAPRKDGRRFLNSWLARAREDQR